MVTLMPDIYFLPQWGEFFKTKEQGGEVHYLEVKNDWGHILYQFIVRPIPVEVEGVTYYDTITPYGFSGPLIIESKPETKQLLIESFDKALQEYCDEHRIVTEYIRFNPWLENRKDFETIYDFRDNGYSYYVDLTVDDVFMQQFASVTRRQIRKALKNNVEIEFDYTGESVPELHRLYNITAERNGIDPYYLFSEESLRDSFVHFKGKQFIISAKHEGHYISSVLVLHHGDYLHYHIAANDPEFFPLAGNSLVIHEICQWGVAHGKKQFHLGGAAPETNLYQFKKNFTKTEPLRLLMGKKIRNQEVYDQLVEVKRQSEGIQYPGYFPLYRG